VSRLLSGILWAYAQLLRLNPARFWQATRTKMNFCVTVIEQMDIYAQMKPSGTNMKRFAVLTVVVMLTSMVMAQDLIAPPEVRGEVVYIPFPVTITLDGELDDWAGVPQVTVDRGPMTSPDPQENGSFAFAVAADQDNFYITMTSVDQNIVTGQHGTDYWNEDSLEFYLNLSGNRYAEMYGDGIFQFNINPGDIGSTDPTDFTLTGIAATQIPVQAIVFETGDGWGFEAAVSITDHITPEHGLEIGFQAQANGATSQDRDVKLIWSSADTADQSWQNPSLFGSAIFFEVGRTDIPQMSERPEPTAVPEPGRTISVNQVGYFPDAVKYGMLAGGDETRVPWSLVNADTGETVTEGMTSEGVFDAASGDIVQTADFSDVTTPGTYRLVIDSVESVPFQISEGLYEKLKIDAVRYFYLNRSGIPLEERYAGEWARDAGHLSDSDVTCWSGTDADGKEWPGCDYRLNAAGGWYDAGDYGKYVVNGGIATWTLLNLYERLPDAYPDGSLNIPESNNGVSDLLDEARWEMEFLLSMQVPDGQPLAGMAHHKLHDARWSGVPVMPPAEVNNDDLQNGRFLMPPTTAATLNLAATAAQCARIWKDIDAAFAERCLTAAEKAWDAANAHPATFTGRTPGQGGGDYSDPNVTDEFYWAAAELFVTTGEEEYKVFITASPFFKTFPGSNGGGAGSMNWGSTAALGTISLAMIPNDLPDEQIDTLREQIIDIAGDRYLATINREGYRVSFTEGNYYWGSSSDVLNNAIILSLAYDFTGEKRFLDAAGESLDYLLGRNALAFSFISGYGENAMQHPHHRFWGNQPGSGFPPPPPGTLAGGPNGSPSDDTAINAGVNELGPAKRYVDLIGSYSTNEVAINWNAPLAWVTAYLDDAYRRA